MHYAALWWLGMLCIAPNDGQGCLPIMSAIGPKSKFESMPGNAWMPTSGCMTNAYRPATKPFAAGISIWACLNTMLIDLLKCLGYVVDQALASPPPIAAFSTRERVSSSLVGILSAA
ncbi:hypothetical protein [Rhodopila sp.]|uniref:hypothetical protein n=1 Tax=Rhodopila sp. TaxID=2480087 RepID=UPI003D0C3F5B